MCAPVGSVCERVQRDMKRPSRCSYLWCMKGPRFKQSKSNARHDLTPTSKSCCPDQFGQPASDQQTQNWNLSWKSWSFSFRGKHNNKNAIKVRKFLSLYVLLGFCIVCHCVWPENSIHGSRKRPPLESMHPIRTYQLRSSTDLSRCSYVKSIHK